MKKIQILILAVILMVAGSAAQSEELMDPGLTPDSPFYFVEQTVEKIEVSTARIVGGPNFVSKVQANNAEERLSEARELISRNKTGKAEKLMKKYSQTLNQSIDNARKSNDTELNKKLGNISDRHVKALKQVERQVPAEAKKGISTALKNSQKSRAKIEKPKPGKKPSDPRVQQEKPIEDGKFGETSKKGQPKRPDLDQQENQEGVERNTTSLSNRDSDTEREKSSILNEKTKEPSYRSVREFQNLENQKNTDTGLSD